MMAENYCYFHYVLQWKKMIAAGRLGEIYYAEGEYIHEITEILEDPKTGEFHGGDRHDLLAPGLHVLQDVTTAG